MANSFDIVFPIYRTQTKKGVDKETLLGIVVTTSPTWSLYRIVVFPAPSNPKIKTRSSFEPKSPPNILEKKPPTNAEQKSNQ